MRALALDAQRCAVGSKAKLVAAPTAVGPPDGWSEGVA